MTEAIARLHIVLSDTDPEIWRRVEVPVEANLKMLHDVIQGAMGWQDCHLWEFEADGRRYGLPDRDWPDDSLAAAGNTRLETLIDRGIRQLDYMYDMGDSWHHSVAIEGVEPGQRDTKYRAILTARAAVRPRTSAERRVSRTSSRPSAILGTPTMRS